MFLAFVSDSVQENQTCPVDPTDVNTIYGRLLWRVQQAKLTHGIRAVIWHQGENDQGADGPTGGYGYETYRQLFVDLAASWKEDYPNIQHYYAFQIWPKPCSMGINGSDIVAAPADPLRLSVCGPWPS